VTIFAAAACAVGGANVKAEDGAGLSFWKRSSAKQTGLTVPRAVGQTSASEDISPLRHPIKYVAAAVSDMPRPSLWKKDQPAVKANKTAKPDPISLDTPAGPPTPLLYISMAQLSERQGDVGQARLHYQTALKKWPGQVDVLRAAARMEDRLGGLQLAENLYQQAVTANPQHAGAHNDLGMCLARQGKLEASLQQIEQAVRLEPTNQRYHNNAAVVLVEMRRDQQALGHLSAVHGPAPANYNMGQLLVERGRTMEAAGYFAAALEIDPTMQAAHAALANLQGAAVGEVPTVATDPGLPVVPQSMTPGIGPQPSQQTVPQQASPAGPQLGYPATARNPGWGTTGYAPPTYYAPTGPYPTTGAPRVSQMPSQYSPPGTLQQQVPVRR
jgi:tetratricopeptide (TPR) repeat protein